MATLIRCKDGNFIVKSEIESFRVVDYPGWHDHQRVTVTTKGGQHIQTGLFESEFISQWEAPDDRP